MPQFRTKTLAKTSNQNLNGQQTLANDDDFLRSFIKNNNKSLFESKRRARSVINKSLLNLNVTNDPSSIIEMRKSFNLRRSQLEQQRLAKSQNFAKTSMNLSRASELPLSKSLVHEKPWCPGKVNQIYYPYRDIKLNRKK